MQELLAFIILFIILKVNRSRTHPITSAKYSCDPLWTFPSLLNHPASFRNAFHYEPFIFLSFIAIPVIADIKLPRNYHVRDDYNLLGYCENMRDCQVNEIDRCCRYVLCSRNVPFSIVALIYDQSPPTVYRDWHHVGSVITDKLGPSIVSRIIPGSAEYYALIGSGPFRYFPGLLYATDIVTCRMCCPADANHAFHYNGMTKQYNYSFMVSVDKNVQGRVYHGPGGGSMSDLEIYYASPMYRHPEQYFLPGHKHACDGIFSRVDPAHCIVPIVYLDRPKTQMERRYNKLQRASRVVVENYFHRLKIGCPVLLDWKFDQDSIAIHFVAMLVLTNIRIAHQSPVRL